MKQASDEFTPVWAAGFMSGTSLDAVDAALILTDGESVLDFGPVAERKYSAGERETLRAAVDAARTWNWQGPEPHGEFEAACEVLTQTHADAWATLMNGWTGPRPEIAGVHGQTVLHRAARSGQAGRTRQILDATGLQSRLGVPLAYDFRSADVAAGGQGAPLAPAYHRALLKSLGSKNGVFLNLGGVANITVQLPGGGLLAMDTGPANGPIDEWVEGHGLGTHDEGGRLASRGRVNDGLIAQLFDNPWFEQPGPKSLDRYDFSANLARGLSPEDGAATLTAFSAACVAHTVNGLPQTPDRMIVSGGGRHNPVLMRELSARSDCPVQPAEMAGFRGDAIEAEAFAFLAVRSLRGLEFSWPGTTGVPAAMSGGVILG